MNYNTNELKERYVEELIHCERNNVANRNIYEYLGSFCGRSGLG